MTEAIALRRRTPIFSTNARLQESLRYASTKKYNSFCLFLSCLRRSSLLLFLSATILPLQCTDCLFVKLCVILNATSEIHCTITHILNNELVFLFMASWDEKKCVPWAT